MMMALSLALLACCLSSTWAAVRFRGSGQLGSKDVQDVLTDELAAKSTPRALKLQEELRQMFASLPKNPKGHLDHKAVRFAVHRYFMHKHGWYIRGIEPEETGPVDEQALSGVAEKDKVPLLLEEAFEKVTADEEGADLPNLALLVATLEDLAVREAKAHLLDAYTAYDFVPTQNYTVLQGQDVVEAYFLSLLVEHNFTVNHSHGLHNRVDRFIRHNKVHPGARDWFGETYAEVVSQKETVDFDTALQAAAKIGQDFYKLNDEECSDMRLELQRLESKKPGRIRLSVFYNQSLNSKWVFSETVDTLRAFGALDETEPHRPSVIITNYALSRVNCINASNLYEICCRNECEDILAHVENEVGASEADAGRIVEVAKAAPSRTMPAPRDISVELQNRLQEIAAANNGKVPLHGRLFAQWLHHTYPLECPSPMEEGTINRAAEQEHTTVEERRQQVEADTCAVNWEGKVECAEESTDLPWDPMEKLLTNSDTSARSDTSAGSGKMLLFLGLAALAAALSVFLAVNARDLSKNRTRQKQASKLAVLLLVGLVYAAGFLDGKALFLALVAGLAAQDASRFAGAKDSSVLPMQAKMV